MSCWFCTGKEADSGKELILSMYGEVGSNPSESGTRVNYNLKTIHVPRCSDCNSRHRIAKRSIFMAVLMLLIAIVFAIFILVEASLVILWGIFLGLAMGLSLGYLMSRHYVEKGIQPARNAKKHYPEVVELLERKYKFGKMPKDHVKEGKNNPPEQA
ncbi:MAG: hypothetical protein R6W96_08910 [Clostridia bacterium]